MATLNYAIASDSAGAYANGIRLAYALQNEVLFQLADLSNLQTAVGVTFIGDIGKTNSDTTRVALSNMGAKTPFVSIGDGVEVTSTTPSFVASDITVGRAALRYDVTALAAGSGMGLNPLDLAKGLVQSGEAYLQSVITGTFAAATLTAGTSGVDMSVDDFFDAMFKLETASNTGPFGMVLHSTQFNDFRSSLRSESNNALSFLGATADMLKAKAPGYVGSIGGVEIYKSNYVTSTGTDYIGAMMSLGAVGWNMGSLTPIETNDGRLLPAGTPMVVEQQRDSSKDLNEYVGNMYVGAGIIDADRIVKIVTDK